jgi:hypothetical protein
MVQVGEAVQRSKVYLGEVFPSAKDQELQLEGVELSDDEKFWYVTFSYLAPVEEKDASSFSAPRFPTYRTVKLSSEDGQFFGARNGVSSKGLM